MHIGLSNPSGKWLNLRSRTLKSFDESNKIFRLEHQQFVYPNIRRGVALCVSIAPDLLSSRNVNHNQGNFTHVRYPWPTRIHLGVGRIRVSLSNSLVRTSSPYAIPHLLHDNEITTSDLLPRIEHGELLSGKLQISKFKPIRFEVHKNSSGFFQVINIAGSMVAVFKSISDWFAR